jgi:hypothetical protein
MSTITSGPTPSIDRVVDAGHRLDLRPVTQGNHTQMLCPAHDDSSPSLSVDYKPDRQLTDIFCHASCDTPDVLSALGLTWSDLFDAPPVKPTGTRRPSVARPPKGPRTVPKPRAPKAPECLGQYDKHDYAAKALGPINNDVQTWYPYVDPTTAEVVAWRLRNRCRRRQAGCTEKETRWRYPTRTGRATGRTDAAPARLPLYGQPALPGAIEAGTTVYVTEGESDADAVTAAGGDDVAVTMGGCDNGKGSTWKSWHTEALAGAASVIVCADRDQVGRISAAYIARQLVGAGVPVRVVEAAIGKDVRDHLDAGHTLVELVDITATITPTKEDDAMTTPATTGAEVAEPTTDPADDAPQTGPTGNDMPGLDWLAEGDWVSSTGAVYRQYGAPKPHLVVEPGPKTKTTGGSSQTLLDGTLRVTDAPLVYGISSDCTPEEEADGTIYKVSFTSPKGKTCTTRISERELQKTQETRWVGRLGLDRYATTANKKRLPDAIGAMAAPLPDLDAYDATGLLLRPGKDPLFLRQGKPALTGDPGVFDHSSTAQLPAAFDGSPGVHCLSLSDPSTASQAGEDWEAWWAVRDIADDGDPGPLLALIAQVASAPWSSLPGMIVPALYIDGESSIGKSALTGLATGWQSDTFTPTAVDSDAVAMLANSLSVPGARSILAPLRGHVVTVDDFFAKRQTARVHATQNSFIDTFGRDTRSGVADAKSKRDGDMRDPKIMRAALLLTGEAFPDPTSSQAARFVRAHLAAGTLALAAHRDAETRNEAFEQAQASVRMAARAHAAGICYGLADLDRVWEAWHWASDLVDTWRIPGSSHLPSGYAMAMFGARMFALQGGRVGVADPEATSPVFAEHLRAMATAQGNASVVRNAIADRYGAAVETIIKNLRTLILAGTWRFDGPEIGEPPTVPGYPPEAFGYTKVTGGRSDLGPPEYRPTQHLAAPLGTIHTHAPGDPGAPPKWPVTARTNGAQRLLVTPDDWARIYAKIAEIPPGADYLPTAEKAREELARSGYLRTVEARPAAAGGPRVLVFDLGRILAGEDGADVASNEPTNENGSHYDDATEDPDGELTALAGGVIDVVVDVIDVSCRRASSQANRVIDVIDVGSRAVLIGGQCGDSRDSRDADVATNNPPDGPVCAGCGRPFLALEQWRAEEGLVCFACLDRGPERAQCQGLALMPGSAQVPPAEPAAEPIPVDADGLPTLCPTCGKRPWAERQRVAYAGFHMACASPSIRAAGDKTLWDRPQTRSGAHDGPQSGRAANSATAAETAPLVTPDGPEEVPETSGHQITPPDVEQEPGSIATPAETAPQTSQFPAGTPLLSQWASRATREPHARRMGVWVDLADHRGITDDGRRFHLSDDGRRFHLSGDMAADVLAGIPADVERVFLCGPPPQGPGGNNAERVRSWGLQPLGPDWEISAKGHYTKDVDSPCFRFARQDPDRQVEILFGSSWFGPDVDALSGREAWQVLRRQVATHFPGAGLLSTPATTGRDLWRRTIPAGKAWPVMSTELRNLVASTSGQGRMELLAPAEGIDSIDAFTYLDARFAYAALTWGMPVGEPEHWPTGPLEEDLAGVLKRRGRWLVRFRIPDAWAHVGILPVKDAAGGWSYPAEPGTEATTWADACEVSLAHMQGWSIELLEGFTWAEGKPLDVWARKLKDIHTVLASAEPIAARGARAMLLHAVGAFATRSHMISKSVPLADEDQVPANAQVTIVDDKLVWEEPQEQSAWTLNQAHPEWSACIWARARVRLLDAPGPDGTRTGALHVPRDQVVAFRTDAVYLSQDPGWPDDGKIGRFRTKGHIDQIRPWPMTNAELFRLRDESERS